MATGWQASREDIRREDEILTRCALRFDGRRYLRETGYDPAPLLDAYIATGDWPEDAEPEHLLAAFYALQRRLNAWGGAPAPRDGKAWFAYRSLFLELAATDVPARYRSAQGWAAWQADYAPRLAEHLALVKHIHEHTAYHEEALGL